MKKRFLTLIITITAMLMCVFGLSACGEKDIKFKLNFVVDNEIYATIDTSGDEVIALPENPKKENHSFDGWYWDKGTWQTPFTANSLLDAPLSSDMSVYAKFSLNTINGVTFSNVETTYDGTEKTIAVSNLPDGASVVYDRANTYINAGEYTVTATVSQENHEDLQLTATLTINKATYDMSGVVFADKTVTYNGEAHSITATNLPDGVSATYQNNGKTNADEYTITAIFTGDTDNYEPIENKTATLTINKATYDMSGVVFADKTVTYNGESHSILATGMPDGISVSYENNNKVNADEYTVTAIFAGDRDNYESIANKTATLTINKATYDMSGLSFIDDTVTYDGNVHSLAITGTLPNGLSVSYENNDKTNADVYTVTAKFTDTTGNYENPENKTATLTINKATYNMNSVVFDDKTVTYNGNAYSIEVQNIPSGLSVSYTGNDKTNVDTYTVTATFTDTTGNYENPENMTATLVINKATITGITFTDKTVTYDTTTHALAIDGNLPACVKVTYTNNDKVNANTYTVTASFEDTSGNYIVPNDMSAKLIINKATVSGISFENKTFTYNGTKRSLEINGILPEEVTVSYVNNGKINANTYNVTATFSCETENYIVPEDMTAVLTIKKAVYDMANVTFENKTVTYDGKIHSLAVSDNLPDGVTVTYENNDKISANQYIVTAIFTGDSINYYAIDDIQAMLTINKATYDMSSVSFENKTVTYDGKTHSLAVSNNLPNGVSVNYTNNDKISANQYIVTASFTGDSINYYAIDDMQAMLTINKATYDMSKAQFVGGRFTYDGTAKSIYVTGELPEGVTVNYTNNEKTNANTYTVTAMFAGDTVNYNKLPDWTASLIIDKATYDMSGVVFADKTVTYNGEAHSIMATNLPDGVSVSYIGNDKINADTYNVTAKFTDTTGNYKNPNDMTATLTINKATITGITFTDKTFTYDTKTHALAISDTLPACVNVTYTNNDKVNANTYTVTASFEDTSGNYIVPNDMSAKLIINKATVSGISFENKTFTYNGTKRSLEINGILPEEVTVSYVNNGKINANTYNVTATFTCETENYVVPDDMTAVLTIKKAVYDMANVTFENKTVTYDGKIHSLAVSDNLPDGVTVTYENNDKISANQYIVTAIFTGDSINYYAIDDMQAMLTINKATYDMSKAQFVGGRFTYDGTAKSIYVTGELPEGVTVNYTNNEKTNANTYTVTAMFAGDTVNYNKLPDWTASLIIDKATYDMSGILFKNQTFTYDKTIKNAIISGTLPNGVEVSYVGNEKTDVGIYTVTAKFNGDSNNYNLIADMTATLKITQAVPYVKEVSCKDTINIYSIVKLIADTDVEGTITFDQGQTLTLGFKTYSWTFVPEDTHNYSNATGTIGLTVCALVSYYNDGTLFNSQNVALNNSACALTDTPIKVDSNGYRYTFLHWSIEENGAEYDFTNAITDNLDLFAVYDSEEIVYVVNYYETKGIEHVNITSYTVSTEYVLNNLEKEHYVFNGWMDQDGNIITKISKGSFGTLNLYAKWTLDAYTITYDLGYRGAQSNAVAIQYTVEDSFVLADASYDEYHNFEGWYLDKDFTNPKFSISAGEFGDIILYAKWNFSGTYITNVSELRSMAYNMSGVYELKNDINLENQSWQPIGDSTNPFAGYFNGADHSINGKTPFGVITGYVKNLKSNVNIGDTNKGYVSYCSGGAGLFVVNRGKISFCNSLGYICSGNYYGGMVVDNYGTIENSCSETKISKTTTENVYIGGMVGMSYTGDIYNCYSTIDIYVKQNKAYGLICIGGLVGEGYNTGIIENSYSTGDISVYSYGDQYGDNSNKVYIGGLVGNSAVSIINCFTDINIYISISNKTIFSNIFPAYIGAISGEKSTLKNCYNAGKISFSAHMDGTTKWVTDYYSGSNGTTTSSYNFMSKTFIKDKFGWDESIWYLEDGQYPQLMFEVE